MIRSIKFVLFTVHLYMALISIVTADVSEREYDQMPELFHLDNFDSCMTLESDMLYCSITFQLSPKSNESNVWNTIKEVIKKPRNYRHDQLRHGICIPKTCPGIPKNIYHKNGNNTDLMTYITKCYQEKYSDKLLTGEVTKIDCQSYESPYDIDSFDIFFGCVCIIIFLLVVFSSFYEGIARYKPKDEYEAMATSRVGKFFTCFSLSNNWERLRKENSSEDAKKLLPIQGIRFYNMVCVIMAHTVMIAFTGPILNPIYTEQTTTKPLNMFLANGSYAVQTFFLISGWLLSYHFFLLFETKKNIDYKYILLAFLNRYARLTPVLLIIIGFSASWLPHISRGPVWDKIVGDEYRNCRKNWWTNVLYINNYYDPKNMCLQQTWYIAADTQLFVLSLFVLTLLWKFQRHVIKILVIAIVIGILIPFMQSYANDFDIVVRSYPEILYVLFLNYRQWHYMLTFGHNNISGYMQGLLFGYFFYKYRNSNIFKNKFLVTLWWVITWCFPVGIILIASIFYQDDYEYSRVGAAFYQAIGRYIFTVGIGVALFGMTQGHGWFMKWFSEWKPVTILGRLTYCAYLVHVTLLRIKGGAIRTPLYITDYLLLTNTVGDIVISYLFATLLCLFIELPISALQKLMVPRLSKQKIEPSPSKLFIKNVENGKECITHKF